MNKRRRIGLIVVNPETIYQSRVLDGVISQCEKYDYDVISYSPLIDVWFSNKDYLKAELNLFELIDFDLIDALIVVAISMTRNSDYTVIKDLEALLKERCTKPVVSIDIPIEGGEMVCTDDAPAFEKITEHILNVHNIPPEDIFVLTGRQDLVISKMRVEGCSKALAAHGSRLDGSRVFYGDYWYSGGAELAGKIISGEVPMPKAVICANDHMATGLINKLSDAGIKIPEQVIVTGYDASQDAVTNKIPITSFDPPVARAAQEAVNCVRRKIDPGLPGLPVDPLDEKSLCIGSSCGCQTNIDFLRANFQGTIYRANHDYTNGYYSDINDMSTIIESYMLEQLTATKTPDECLEMIYKMTYLISPYRNFYLCLRPDWLSGSKPLLKGYPEKMKICIHTVPREDEAKDDKNIFWSDNRGEVFETSKLLPILSIRCDKPGVFYVFPVHFQGDTLGYCVVHCDLSDRVKPTVVTRNWVRNVNSALEMTRVQHRLISFSLYDNMTGLYNRRGMERAFAGLCRRATKNDSCFACVIDMNWLKKINDLYGHSEGDQAIIRLADCARGLVTDDRFVAVRAGGDEFFVIGIGRFDEDLPENKMNSLIEKVEKVNRDSGKPYKISASVGCCLRPYSPGVKLEELIHEADARMYEFKKRLKQTETFEE
ncbi:MAG: GGDEF domain-containing protein [Ruminococcus sp.]|nr:GGDEF domain-containing protein [Ruminococcus sp.]